MDDRDAREDAQEGRNSFLPPEMEVRSTVICLPRYSVNYWFVKSKLCVKVTC